MSQSFTLYLKPDIANISSTNSRYATTVFWDKGLTVAAGHLVVSAISNYGTVVSSSFLSITNVSGMPNYTALINANANSTIITKSAAFSGKTPQNTGSGTISYADTSSMVNIAAALTATTISSTSQSFGFLLGGTITRAAVDINSTLLSITVAPI